MPVLGLNVKFKLSLRREAELTKVKNPVSYLQVTLAEVNNQRFSLASTLITSTVVM